MDVLNKARELVAKLWLRWRALEAAQRRTAMLSTLAFIALTSLAAWWSTRTDWRTLYRDGDGRDTAQVQQELSAAGIGYQTTSDGAAIQVAAESLDKARVAIAAKGMPQSGRLGFELFDKPNWAGSEFDEKVNYQRALEGELEHTLTTLDVVRSARVHLVMPVHAAFSSEDQPAKASVVLTLRRSLDARAEGPVMRSLVAGAVEGLTPGAVTIVDADGRVDFAGTGEGPAAREEENSLQQKLISVLEPLTGAGNVRATVTVLHDTGTQERTDEVYDPNGAVPLSTQRVEQTAQGSRAGGVAGTASNTPALTPAITKQDAAAPEKPGATAAAGATAPAGTAAASVQPATSGGSQLSREESSSFAVSHHTTHMEEGPGRIRRIAAAIVVNDRAVSDGTRKTARTSWKPRTPDEMKHLQQLAEAAIGFDSARGDQVVVQNLAFSGNADDSASATGFAAVLAQGRELLRSQPSLLRSVVIGASLLALGMLVLRPLGRQAVGALALPPPSARIQDAQVVFERVASESAVDVQETAPQEESQAVAQRLLDQVTARIQAEPRSNARLVESWLAVSPEVDS